ncbi:MAG: AsmA-like C-terminal region-containing protein [Pirellulaceae bacterium]
MNIGTLGLPQFAMEAMVYHTDDSGRISHHWRALAFGVRQCVSCVAGFLLLAAIGLGAVYLFRDDLTSELGRTVSRKVNEQLAQAGWQVEIESVALSDQNVSLRNVRLFSLQTRRSLASLSQVELSFGSAPSPEAAPLSIRKIILDQSKVKIDVAAAEADEINRLKQFLDSLPKTEGPPSFHARNVALESQNSDFPERQPVTLQDINASFRADSPMGEPNVLLHGHSNLFRQLIVRAMVGGDGDWTSTLQIDGLCLNGGLLERLSALHPAISDVTRIEGAVDINVNMAGSKALPFDESRLQVTARLAQFELAHRDLSFPVSKGSGTVIIQNGQIQCRDVHAMLGNGSCQFNYWQRGLFSRDDWDLAGTLSNVQVNPRLKELLPPGGKKFMDDFSPNGLVSLRFHWGNIGRQPIEDVTAQIHDLAGTFHKFPYRLEHCVGIATWKNRNCEFDIQALEQGQVVEIKGNVSNPGPDATFDVRFGCAGELAIDDKLMEAVSHYPQVHRQITMANPQGKFRSQGSFRKPVSDVNPILNFRVDVSQATVQHDLFDYPFRNVMGTLFVDGEHVQFHDFTGENLATTVLCNGNWEPARGLDLQIIANRAQLDEQLKHALPAIVRQVWDELRPSGQLPLSRVDVSWPVATRELRVGVMIDARVQHPGSENNLSVSPSAFPYSINNIAGMIQVADGVVRFNKMSGKHGRSWVTWDGGGRYGTDRWNVRIDNILTGAVPVDNDLLMALPSDLRSAIEASRFRGNINVSGSIDIHSGIVSTNAEQHSDVQLASYEVLDEVPTGEPGVDWNLRIDTDGASMMAGIELSQIHGLVALAGNYDGKTAVSSGKLKIDSLEVLGMQVTSIEGPVFVDQDHVGVGMFAVPLGSNQHSKSLTGRLFDGQLSFDGHTWFADKQRFYLQTTLESASLKDAAATWAPTFESISGTGQVGLRLSGDCESIDSLTGEGMMKMYKARIYELPVLLATLKQMRKFNEDRSAFDTCDIEFAIKGRKATINRMELQGDPISLIGNGVVDLEQNVDLNFFTVAGGNRLYVPVLTELYEASSQNILWIQVDGTLGDPQTHRKILPGVNEGLRELFQPPK